jgi:RNA polymerase sigma factor (sigma-70 family)
VTAPRDFAEFCIVEYPRLVGALSLYCGDPDVAEDIAQDALVRACQRWSQVRRMPAPGAWVYRVAVNLTHSHYRRTRTLHRLLERQGRHEPGVLEDTDQVAVRMLVASLPRRSRQAVIARFFLQLSVAETADALGLTESAVRSLTHRAIQTLREQLGVSKDSTTISKEATHGV